MVQLTTVFVVAAPSYCFLGRQTSFFPSHYWRF